MQLTVPAARDGAKLSQAVSLSSSRSKEEIIVFTISECFFATSVQKVRSWHTFRKVVTST
jgi:hypothetical protein